MRINGKNYLDDATMAEAAKLIWEAELTLSQICKLLHTTMPVLTRSMGWHFHISDWKGIHAVKRSIFKEKRDVRIVWECQSCSYEAGTEFGRCQKCGSYSIEKKELRNKIRADEMRAIKR